MKYEFIATYVDMFSNKERTSIVVVHAYSERDAHKLAIAEAYDNMDRNEAFISFKRKPL